MLNSWAELLSWLPSQAGLEDGLQACLHSLDRLPGRMGLKAIFSKHEQGCTCALLLWWAAVYA